MEVNNMKILRSKTVRLIVSFFVALTFFSFATDTVIGQAASPKTKAFASAEVAANALIDAAEKFDTAAIKEILGADSSDIIDTGEPFRDRELVVEFAALARTKLNVAYAPKNKTRAFLEVGADGWPFPVPIVKRGTKWYFDTPAGRQELIFRRIGSNEYDAMNICDSYVDAQFQYAATKQDGARVNQYAQRIISSPGKKDGLAWQNADGTWGGFISDDTAKLLANIYIGRQEPFHGYYFKILKAQGTAAQGGAFNYVANGAMIGGFALIAYPSIYQVTGVKSFIVNHEGVIYEKDLGPKTAETARLMELFDPDRTWTPVPEQ